MSELLGPASNASWPERARKCLRVEQAPVSPKNYESQPCHSYKKIDKIATQGKIYATALDYRWLCKCGMDEARLQKGAGAG